MTNTLAQSPQAQRALLTELMLKKHRAQFPTLARKAYLNFGASGIMPQSALDRIQQRYEAMLRDAPFSTDHLTATGHEVNLTRAAIAREFNVTPQTISLVENTSVGCNIALWGLDWRRGDRLILTADEYPGVIAAIDALRDRFDLEIVRLAAGPDPLDRLAESLNARTRLVALSHIPWNTGQVLPLAEIAGLCRRFRSERPIRVLVDGAQSVGVLPLDLSASGADFYAFTGHKWWCGPEGVGGLYVSPEASAELRPTFVGWRGLELENDRITGLAADGRRFETGTAAFPLFGGLLEAIACHNRWGDAQARFRRIQTLAAELRERLARLDRVTPVMPEPATQSAGLVFFTIDGPVDELVRYLESREVLVRTIPMTNLIRASVHYLTLSEDLDRLIEGIGAFFEDAVKAKHPDTFESIPRQANP